MSQKADLSVFAHLDSHFVPTGKLTLTEQGTEVQASEFVYGLKYLERSNALEIDPVSLSLLEPERVRGQRLFPVDNLPLFGGIRDCAPDAWGRRVIEARRKAPMNSLPESVYLLEAGSQRVGALDVRESISAKPREALPGRSSHPRRCRPHQTVLWVACQRGCKRHQRPACLKSVCPSSVA